MIVNNKYKKIATATLVLILLLGVVAYWLVSQEGDEVQETEFSARQTGLTDTQQVLADARAAISEEDIELAQDLTDKALEENDIQDSEKSMLYHKRGIILQHKEQHDVAKEAFLRAQDYADGEHPQILRGVAESAEHTGQYTTAYEYYSQLQDYYREQYDEGASDQEELDFLIEEISDKRSDLDV